MTRYLLLFLLCCTASAQTTLKSATLAGGATMATLFIPGCPQSLLIPFVDCTNLLYFWTYETVPIGAVSTQWNDIVASAPLWMQGTNKLPTNTVSGMRFSGGTTKLTNNLIISEGKSCWMVLSFENPADSPAICVSSTGQYFGPSISSSRFLLAGSPARFLSSALPSTNIIDYALISIAGGFSLYTNAVFAGSANDYGQFTAEMFGNAPDDAHGLVGTVLNYAWYTNAFDTNIVNALHQWRTNRYGGTP